MTVPTTAEAEPEPTAPGDTTETTAPAAAAAARTKPPRPTRRFLWALAAIALLGCGIRTTALIIAPKCRQPSKVDLSLALIGKVPEGGKCVVLTDAPVFVEQANQNALGYWYQSAPLNAQGTRQPSALHPPLFAAFLTIFTLAGVHSFDSLRAIASLLGIGTIVLSGLFGRRLAGERIGLIAAFLVAVNPMVWINDVVLMSEGLFALFVPLVGWAALRFWERRDMRSAVVLGATIGLAALTRSEAILLVLIAGIPLCIGRTRLREATAWKQLGAVVAAAALVVAPWVGANLVRFKVPTTFTTTTGFSMAFANCPAVYKVGPMLGERSPACLTYAREHLVLHNGDDQSSVDSYLLKGALRTAADHPGGATLAGLARVGRMWGVYEPFQTVRIDEPLERRGVGRSELAVVFGWEVMVAGAWGAVLLKRKRVPISFLVGWVVTSTVVAFGDLGLQRFRASSDVALCILAAVAIDHLWSSARPAQRSGSAGAPVLPS
jgi:4-amino-4-deoxy-L-arabinose transferase-like glycosyltransferase